MWVTRDGIKAINIKIEAITNIKPPTSQKEVQNLMGLIDYYRDMWTSRSYMLAPLTRLISIKKEFKWTQVKQDAFEKIKLIVDRDTLLNHPGFNETF